MTPPPRRVNSKSYFGSRPKTVLEHISSTALWTYVHHRSCQNCANTIPSIHLKNPLEGKKLTLSLASSTGDWNKLSQITTDMHFYSFLLIFLKSILSSKIF